MFILNFKSHLCRARFCHALSCQIVASSLKNPIVSKDKNEEKNDGSLANKSDYMNFHLHSLLFTNNDF